MIKIVTDSTVCMTRREAEEIGVEIVPITYIVDGELFYESYSDENGDIEGLLKSKKEMTTSQPSPDLFQTVFEKQLALGNEVLCLTLSSRVSGTYSAAYMAATQMESGHVFVYDSLLSAGALYLLVLEAVKLVEKGLSLAVIIEELDNLRQKASIFFTLDDMTRLRKSGRIGFVRMNVGTYLNIMPILQCKDGIIVADGVVRGKNNAVKKLTDIVPAQAKGIVINHISPNPVCTDLINALSRKFPHLTIKLSKMGPVLGIHLGPSVVAVSFIV